jgi:hypothetical protein
MELNRRDFLTVPAALTAASLFAADATVPWQHRIRRVGQTNMTEHDPAVLDIEQWADYWASLKVDAVMVSVTGILATRPRCRSTARANFSAIAISSAIAARRRRSVASTWWRA